MTLAAFVACFTLLTIHDEAFAVNYVIQGEASCEAAPVLGTWDSVANTCTTNGFNVDFDDSVAISFDPAVILVNNGNIVNNGHLESQYAFNNFGTIDNFGTLLNQRTFNNAGTINNEGVFNNNINFLFVFFTNNGVFNNDCSGRMFGDSISGNPATDVCEPLANSQSPSANEDTGASITITGSNPEVSGNPFANSQLTFFIQTQPENGTLALTGTNSTTSAGLLYTPNGNFSGTDSFTFIANDGANDSTAGTVSITINAVNDLPVADNQNVTTNEDIAVGVTLTGSDPVEASGVSFFIDSQPENGTLSGTVPNLTYTPDGNFSGSDSFTFVANDGTDNSTAGTISITIIAVNDVPVADSQNLVTNEDTAAEVTLSGSDVENALTFSVQVQPENGTLSGTAPNLTYTPDANFTGTDSFTFVANDGTVDSAVATVSLSIIAVNDVPVANPQSVATDEDHPVDITLSGSDVETANPAFSVQTQPGNGTLSGVAPDLTYTPDANFTGSDSFTFIANDGANDSAAATVSITVNAVNDLPSASAQNVTTDEDESAAITLTGSDIDGDPLSYTVLTQPASGTLSGTAPNLTYTPDPDFNGADSFTFLVNDGTGNSTPATVTITVNPVAEEEDEGNSGGRGGKRVVTIHNNPQPAGSVDVLPDSHFVANPLDRIGVSNSTFLNGAGAPIETGVIGQQVGITGTFSNHQQVSQDYAFIVQITDKDGFVVYVGWQEGTIESGQTADISLSWTPEPDGSYSIKIFVWDRLQAPAEPLSQVTLGSIQVTA